jgi:predicted RNA binding protein YcfA (HicA-like mRNA interferase family)
MTGLPVVSGSRCISALIRAGYSIICTKGSHVLTHHRMPHNVPADRQFAINLRGVYLPAF